MRYTVSHDPGLDAVCDWHLAVDKSSEPCPVKDEAVYVYDEVERVDAYFYLCAYHAAIVKRDGLVEIVESDGDDQVDADGNNRCGSWMAL